MPKATITWDLSEFEDRMDFKQKMKASELTNALWEIQQQVFRPARKHGYPDKELAKLYDACGDTEEGYSLAEELIGKLEDKFCQLLADNDIDIDELVY